jgi:hypothetical protein
MGFRGIVIKEGKSGAGRRPFELINYFRHGISLTMYPLQHAHWMHFNKKSSGCLINLLTPDFVLRKSGN